MFKLLNLPQELKKLIIDHFVNTFLPTLVLSLTLWIEKKIEKSIILEQIGSGGHFNLFKWARGIGCKWVHVLLNILLFSNGQENMDVLGMTGLFILQPQ